MDFPGGTRWSPAQVESLLPTSIPRIRTGILYVAGLAGVGCCLILLQAAYLALVGLSAYATAQYVAYIPTLLQNTHLSAPTLVLIATPAVAGVIVVLFLLKPLLARPGKQPEPLELDAAAEPALFAFVTRLCRALGAPAPEQVFVDLQVNASAAFHREWRGLLRGRLTLTIGLPLAAGLSVHQFAGILAHEFGHFSQRGGMRLIFLIVTIRNWFARVAHERDNWDAWLASNREHGSWHLKIILSVAALTVYLSRLILRGLLWVAELSTAWFSRQMEFDADRRAAALVGGTATRGILLKLPTLDAAAQSVLERLNRSWAEQRLADDFAYLVWRQEAEFEDSLRLSITEATLEAQTGFWDRHPSTAARAAHVENIPGVLDAATPGAEAPAWELFADFAALARRATRFHFENTLGEKFAATTLVPAPKYFEETAIETRRVEAVQRRLGALQQPWRWFRLPDGPLEGTTLNVFMSLKDETTEYWRLLGEALHQRAALEFLRCGGKVNPQSFHLAEGTVETATTEAAASHQALLAEMARLRDLYRTHGYLLPPGRDEYRRAYKALAAEQEELLELRYEIVSFEMLLEHAAKLEAATSANALDRLRRQLGRRCDGILSRLAPVPCPALAPGEAGRSLADRLRLSGSAELEPQELAQRILDRSDAVGSALLGELAADAATP